MPPRGHDLPEGPAPGGEESIAELRIELEATRRECDRLRRAVQHARTTAHDLAQPLTTVLARAQLLLRRARPDGPDYKALSILSEEAGRLAAIVERFQTLRELVSPDREAPPANPSGDTRRST